MPKSFTWNPYPEATGYNVYRSPAYPVEFVLSETNIPVSVLELDCEWVIVTAITPSGETSINCTPLFFCPPVTLVPDNIIDFGERHQPVFTDLFPEAGQHLIPQFTAGGSVGPITWTVDEALPTGITFSSDGTFAGTPTDQLEYPDCVVIPGVDPKLRGKLHTLTFHATDFIGNIGTQIIDWYVVLAVRFQLTYTLPAGCSLFDTTGIVITSPYNDVGWFIEIATYPGFIGHTLFPLRNISGVYLGATGTGASPPETGIPIASNGIGAFLYDDLSWRNVISFVVTFGPSWTGVLAYDGAKGSLYKSEVIPLTRWLKTSGTDADPPDLSGGINLTVS